LFPVKFNKKNSNVILNIGNQTFQKISRSRLKTYVFPATLNNDMTSDTEEKLCESPWYKGETAEKGAEEEKEKKGREKKHGFLNIIFKTINAKNALRMIA